MILLFLVYTVLMQAKVIGFCWKVNCWIYCIFADARSSRQDPNTAQSSNPRVINQQQRDGSAPGSVSASPIRTQVWGLWLGTGMVLFQEMMNSDDAVRHQRTTKVANGPGSMNDVGFNLHVQFKDITLQARYMRFCICPLFCALNMNFIC